MMVCRHPKNEIAASRKRTAQSLAEMYPSGQPPFFAMPRNWHSV
jgi:hypothetical protein